MAELNPHQQMARVFALACYIVAGLVLVAGFFFTLAAATMDLSQSPVRGAVTATNARMALMMASVFAIIALMIVLLGWRVRSLFGQERRQEKLLAKSAVGCLRLTSLGCGLWLVPSTATGLLTGVLIFTGEPVGIKEVLVGVSGPILLIILMLSSARFISVNFVRLKGERAYDDYLKRIRTRLPDLAHPAARAYVQEQTLEVLPKLGPTLKSDLLDYLSKSRLLTGPNRIALRDADFSGVDLRSINLPHADLRGINLERAKLQGAILFEASLHKARLNRADLSRAVLQGADLRQADLTDAVLDGTNLRDANLLEAIVTPTQLGQARLCRPSGA
jgi:Pentapeptide repeats (8 copies)